MRRVAADIAADAAVIDAIPVEIKGWPPQGTAIGAAPAPAAAPARADWRKPDPQHESTKRVFAAVEEAPKISVAASCAPCLQS